MSKSMFNVPNDPKDKTQILEEKGVRKKYSIVKWSRLVREWDPLPSPKP